MVRESLLQRKQAHCVVNGDPARSDNIAVKSELTVEFFLNAQEYTEILSAGIRIKGSHDAAGSKIFHRDEHRSDL